MTNKELSALNFTMAALRVANAGHTAECTEIARMHNSGMITTADRDALINSAYDRLIAARAIANKR